MDFAPRRACSGPRHAPAPITRAAFLATVEARAPRHKHVQLEGQFCSLVHILCVWKVLQPVELGGECHNFYSKCQPHLISIYMPRPYLYLILSLHRHMATTSDPMRW
jgi:hypothetical protein